MLSYSYIKGYYKQEEWVTTTTHKKLKLVKSEVKKSDMKEYIHYDSTLNSRIVKTNL